MTFQELTVAQQEKAVENMMTEVLQAYLEGVRFEDETLNSRIDDAIEKADSMQTPWFAHEYIMDTCSEDVKNLARTWAENTVYSDEITRPIPKV